jgi:hypothetical protein
MILLPLLALLALATLGSHRGLEFDQTHKLWSEVLSAHVRGGGFDYKKLKDDRAKLDAYLGSLETVMPEEFAGWKRAQQFAYWIDAYNAYVVRRVVDAYPIASIEELGEGKTAVWDQEFIPLSRLFPEAGDRKLTLNDVENRILRPKFKDARVHVALSCASRGCPPILAEAFVAERLEKQLDAQVARWLADPERNRFDKKSGKIVVSKIFDWFQEDFARDAGSVQAWIAARAPESERAWLSSAEGLKIEFLDYSWKLNEAR